MATCQKRNQIDEALAIIKEAVESNGVASVVTGKKDFGSELEEAWGMIFCEKCGMV